MTELPLADYARTLTGDIQTLAEAEDGSIPKTFTRWALEQLEESGFVSNMTVAYHSGHGFMVYGFGYSDDRSVLDLYTTDFSLDPVIDKLTKADVTRHFRRLLAFLQKAGSIRSNFDQPTEVHQLCEGVEKLLVNASKVRLFLFSNCESTARTQPETTEFQGLPVEHHLWDLTRLYRHQTSGAVSEPIVVEFNPPIDCLSVQSTEPDLSVTLAVVPGRHLAELYEEHRTRLLELNVRAFLQARSAVNRGIRLTLLNEPGRFLAYNNGITATATAAEFVEDAAGRRVGIRSLTGLQIVNGGQTTATLHHVFKRDKKDLAGVSVQMKLTLMNSDDLMEIVPSISKYSNTQNKVTLVDLSANDKFHVKFEQVSRTLWAPSTTPGGPQTRWFYERARGSYAVEEAKHTSVAARRKFKADNPASQRFAKSDLAKFVNAWNGLPHLVSRGAQKGFAAFQANVKEQPPVIDADYCRRTIAMGILFKEIDKVAKSHDAGSHKALITAYTMARLCEETGRRIDLDRIWREQKASNAITQAAHDLCPLIMEGVIQEGKHVTEWAKSSKCWEEVSGIPWTVPEDLVDELLAKSVEFTVDTQEEEEEQLSRLKQIPLSEWEMLADWARETRALELAEQQIATTIATKLASNGTITAAQVRKALEVYDNAIEEGFSAFAP
ncbi:AIPR family protein [Streptomyces sp. NPDC090093]|uniref:AIPR family protein n=1 Tax=Streptomyces sp. NPDC090093 TaxID=3365945 RepID=UPI00382C2C12